jgi:arylsulfatase A-like enzyme
MTRAIRARSVAAVLALLAVGLFLAYYQRRGSPSVPMDTDAPPPTAGPATQRPPDVFIYLVDALRPDHLGCYGYPRGSSPAIDAFAAEATLYESAHTAATWTRPSVATLLTGLYPCVHATQTQIPHIRLPDWPWLLSEVLGPAGYKTALVSANMMVSELFGFNQGWDSFLCSPSRAPQRAHVSCRWVNARAAEFLTEQDAQQPVFLYLHVMETHLPYQATPDNVRRFDRGFESRWEPTWEPDLTRAGGWLHPDLTDDEVQYLVDHYDACVFEADQGFGEFLEVLRSAGRLDNSVVILLADHGESFMEHGTIGHGHTLNREEMQVPLVVRFPGSRFAGTRIRQKVSLVDIYPSILRITGVEPPAGYPLSRRDLAGLASARAWLPSEPVFAQLSRYGDGSLDLLGVIDPAGYKLVLNTSHSEQDVVPDAAVGLWDTARDPAEQVNLEGELRERVENGDAAIRQWLATASRQMPPGGRAQPQRVEVSQELRHTLGALGYLR